MADGTPVDQFLVSFVRPLVLGGKVEVDGIASPTLLKSFVTERTTNATVLQEITNGIRSHISRIGPVGNVDLLSPDALALSLVWHNFFAMTHPEVAPRPALRKRVRAWTQQLLEWVGLPQTAHEVALRYGLLGRLGEVGRVDTEVTFWAGHATYLGVSPPTRLVAWKNLRRVQERITRITLFDLVNELASEDPELDLVLFVRLALALSPLTDLSLLERPAGLAFRWTPAGLNALTDHGLRGAMTRIVLATPPGTVGDRAAEYAASKVRMIETASREAVLQMPKPAAAYLSLLHLELLAAEALGRMAPPPGHALGYDIVSRLGIDRASNLLGIDKELFIRALRWETNPREPNKEAPAVALLGRAGLLEVSS